MAALITAKDLAREAGTDGKRMRRFMRKLADAATTDGGEPIVPRCGQGNRYAISRSQANALLKLWRATHAPQATQATPDETPDGVEPEAVETA